MNLVYYVFVVRERKSIHLGIETIVCIRLCEFKNCSDNKRTNITVASLKAISFKRGFSRFNVQIIQ